MHPLNQYKLESYNQELDHIIIKGKFFSEEIA